MSIRRSLSAAAVLTLLAATLTAAAFPKPAAVPYRWELNFEPGDLRLWVDALDGRAYWHFTYKVTNRTGKDQMWAPSLVLFTDTGRIIPSGRTVPPRVTQALLTLFGNPLLMEQNSVIGTIRQGRENAIEGLAVWPADHLGVNEISLFVSGISGETARVNNPVTGDPVILRKTLQRDYLIPGDAIARGSKPVEKVAERWIMR